MEREEAHGAKRSQKQKKKDVVTRWEGDKHKQVLSPSFFFIFLRKTWREINDPPPSLSLSLSLSLFIYIAKLPSHAPMPADHGLGERNEPKNEENTGGEHWRKQSRSGRDFFRFCLRFGSLQSH